MRKGIASPAEFDKHIKVLETSILFCAVPGWLQNFTVILEDGQLPFTTIRCIKAEIDLINVADAMLLVFSKNNIITFFN